MQNPLNAAAQPYASAHKPVASYLRASRNNCYACKQSYTWYCWPKLAADMMPLHKRWWQTHVHYGYVSQKSSLGKAGKNQNLADLGGKRSLFAVSSVEIGAKVDCNYSCCYGLPS